MVFDPFFAENVLIFVKNSDFCFFGNQHFCLFPGVLDGKLKFQNKVYDLIDYNKWPSSEKPDKKMWIFETNKNPLFNISLGMFSKNEVKNHVL